MHKQFKRAELTLKCVIAFAVGVLLAGTGCDEETMALLNGVPGAGDYYYGFYENDGSGPTNGFSMYPGSDVGDSLETYLSGYVSY